MAKGKQPAAAVPASFKVLNVSKERSLLREVLQERRITVSERVAKMERNIADVRRRQAANNVSLQHRAGRVSWTVELSDLMIASLHGAVQPRDETPCPFDAAVFDPEWVEVLEVHYKSMGSKTLAQLQAEHRKALEEDVDEHAIVHAPRRHAEATIARRGSHTSAGQASGEPDVAQSAHGEPSCAEPELDERRDELCKPKSRRGVADTNKPRKPIYKSVASRLRRTLQGPGQRKHAKKLNSQALATLEENEMLGQSCNATPFAALPPLPRNAKPSEAKVAEDAVAGTCTNLDVAAHRKRRLRFIGKNFASMCDVLGFGGGPRSQKKNGEFEIDMQDVINGTVDQPVEARADRSKKRNSKRKPSKKRHIDRHNSAGTDGSVGSLLSASSGPNSPTSAESAASCEAQDFAGVGACKAGRRYQPLSAGQASGAPTGPGLAHYACGDAPEQQAGSGFDHLRFYFNAHAMAASLSDPRRGSTDAGSSGKSGSSSSSSKSAKGSAKSFADDTDFRDPVSASFMARSSSRAARETASFSVRRLPAGSAADRSRLGAGFDDPDATFTTAADASGRSLKRAADCSGRVSVADSEFTILEEDYDDDGVEDAVIEDGNGNEGGQPSESVGEGGRGATDRTASGAAPDAASASMRKGTARPSGAVTSATGLTKPTAVIESFVAC